MPDRPQWLRRLGHTFRLIMYVGFAGSGIGQFVGLSDAVRVEAGALAYVWASMLTAGGVLAAIGVAGSWWFPQLLAQPLLAFPFALWAVAVMGTDLPGRWIFLSLCVVIIAHASAQATDIWWMVRRQVRHKQEGM